MRHSIPPIAVVPCLRGTRRSAAFRAGRASLLVAMLAAAAGAADADICKYSDADGNIHYSNVPPERGWKKLGCTIGDDATVRGGGRESGAGNGARSASTPASFPRVTPEAQRGRDDVRKKVLSEELATEEKLLAEARDAYAEGAPVPLPDEKGDAEKYRARIGKLRQSFKLHEKNVEALKKEISAVK